MPPQAPKRSGFLKGCLIVAVIALVLLVVGGFFVWRFVNEQVIPELEQTADVFNTFTEAPPGPCYDLDIQNGLLAGWNEVSCDGPRDVEVAFAAQFEDGPFPGDGYLTSQAENTCRDAFVAYIGLDPEDSVYGADWLLPTEDTWAVGARQGICFIVSDDGSPLIGLVKGSET